ncbi:hypothetical protein MC885_013882 [Smutsia gigantea]|nr:hypothetical protein MC885_013882 [Smutsia gigantea]
MNRSPCICAQFSEATELRALTPEEQSCHLSSLLLAPHSVTHSFSETAYFLCSLLTWPSDTVTTQEAARSSHAPAHTCVPPVCLRRLTGYGIHHCFARSMMGHEVKVPLLENFYADYYTVASIALASCLAMCVVVRFLGRRGGLLLFMILTALASLLQLGLLNLIGKYSQHPDSGMSDSVKDKFSITFSIVGMFASHAVGSLSVFFCAEITPTVIRCVTGGSPWDASFLDWARAAYLARMWDEPASALSRPGPRGTACWQGVSAPGGALGPDPRQQSGENRSPGPSRQ